MDGRDDVTRNGDESFCRGGGRERETLLSRPTVN